MNTSSSSAPSASSKSKAMICSWKVIEDLMRSGPSWRKASIIAMAGLLAACTSVPLPPASTPSGAQAPAGARPGEGPLPPPRLQGKSRWVPVHWSELPGFEDDTLFEAWNAWIKSCERPGPVFAPLCGEVRRLSIASGQEQRAWMVARLQPYRVETHQGVADGLLTSYYEPVLKASRQPGTGYEVPLYRPPASLGNRKPWFSRQEIDTLPEARTALRGREIAWVDNPVEVMSLHIQGSGRLNITEPDGSQRIVRVAYAGSNEQPFRSVTQWLVEQGEGRMVAPWVESTKAWASKNPQRVQQMLWSNPRYTFFQEQP
ncbi:MAG: MltA domain-containing protein, partial [Polaromonas sp.]